MILPTKHVPVHQSLLGVGVTLLRHLDRPRTVTALWDLVRSAPGVLTFGRMTTALGMLYAMEAVHYQGGLLTRGK